MISQYDNLVSSTSTVVLSMMHNFHNDKELLLTCTILNLSI